MFRKIASLFKGREPIGPTEPLRRFTKADLPIDRTVVQSADGSWRIDTIEQRIFRLYEISNPGVEQCRLSYRARMRGEAVAKPAYLEMYCRLPGRGEFFSKGLAQPLSGTTDWASYETLFILKAGQCPDLIKLNLAMEGAGAVWIRDLELLSTPLSA